MNMYVVPSYRKQGIATGMLEFVMAYSKAHSYHKVMLNAS